MESMGSLETTIGRGLLPGYNGGRHAVDLLLGVAVFFFGGGAGGARKPRSKPVR